MGGGDGLQHGLFRLIHRRVRGVYLYLEEAENFTALAESLDTPAYTDQIVRDTVLENVRLCLDGEMSEEETVNAVMQTINLYLAE